MTTGINYKIGNFLFSSVQRHCLFHFTEGTRSQSKKSYKPLKKKVPTFYLSLLLLAKKKAVEIPKLVSQKKKV